MLANTPLQQSNAPIVIINSDFLAVRSQLNARVVRPRRTSTAERVLKGVRGECVVREVFDGDGSVRDGRMREGAREAGQ